MCKPRKTTSVATAPPCPQGRTPVRSGHHGVTPGRTRGVDPRPRGRLLAALVAPLALLIACGTAAPPPAPPRVAPVAVVPIMAATPAADPPVLTPVPAQPMAAS